MKTYRVAGFDFGHLQVTWQLMQTRLDSISTVRLLRFALRAYGGTGEIYKTTYLMFLSLGAVRCDRLIIFPCYDGMVSCVVAFLASLMSSTDWSWNGRPNMKYCFARTLASLALGIRIGREAEFSGRHRGFLRGSVESHHVEPSS